MPRGWSRFMYRRAVVHLTTGRTFVGLVETRGPLLVLRDASVIEGGEHHVDGEVVVERERVEWVQMLPSGGPT